MLVPREAWDWAKVPEHLRPTFRVVDESGREQARGKDLEALKEPLRPRFAEAMASAAADSGITVSGQTTWTFGTIEKAFTTVRAGHEVRGFPALVDEGATVGLQVFGSEDEQEARHRLGVRRLLQLGTPSPVKAIVDSFGNAEKLGLAGSPYPSVAELLDDCVAAVLQQAVDARPPVRSEQEYAALAAAVRLDLEARVRAVVRDVFTVLAAWRHTDKALSGRAEMATLPALSDMKSQLARLVRRGFVADAGADQLRQLPRTSRPSTTALAPRRRRACRDRQLMEQISDLQASWEHRMEALPEGRPPGEALRRVRWMLEEYRVSLWAQHLGTAHPISDARIRKALPEPADPCVLACRVRSCAPTCDFLRPSRRTARPGRV